MNRDTHHLTSSSSFSTSGRRKRADGAVVRNSAPIVVNSKSRDASCRLSVSNANLLMGDLPTTNTTSTPADMHLCLVCDDRCTCESSFPSTEEPSLSSPSTVLSKYVKSLSKVDKDTLLEALKQMSPSVFKSITQTLKKKKILDEAIPQEDWSQSSYSTLQEAPLLIIDNNVSYDHQASFYNHLNSISANAAMTSSNSFSNQYHHQSYLATNEEIEESSITKRAFPSSPDVPNSPSFLDELVELGDLLVDYSSEASEEYERVFSRSHCQSLKRRPSITPLKKIPKVAAFRNPDSDPYINVHCSTPVLDSIFSPSLSSSLKETFLENSSKEIYFEKVTSWLSPSETSSLVSALQFSNSINNDVMGSLFFSQPETLEKEIQQPSNRILSGLLKDLANVSVSDLSCDEDDEYVEIEFAGGYSEDGEEEEEEEGEEGQNLLSVIETSSSKAEFELYSHKKSYRSSIIDPSSFFVEYSTELATDSSDCDCKFKNHLSEFEEESGENEELYSLCNCNGICFCGAFVDVEIPDADGLSYFQSSHQEDLIAI